MTKKPDQNLSELKIKIACCNHYKDLPLPKYATEAAAGMDLLAAIDKEITLKPGQRKLLPTGIKIALPLGYEAQVRPRSGLAIKNGITLLNSPGTIDADYRGEIKVIIINLSEEEFIINRGMRIAQLVIMPIMKGIWQRVDELDETTRGSGGFGHTGLKN